MYILFTWFGVRLACTAHFRFVLAITCLLCSILPRSHAHDIRIVNPVLVDQNASAGFTQVQFDLSWKSSWRYDFSSGINNWDAAWVFVKFKVGATNPAFTGVSLTSGSAEVTLSSTANLRVGMPVSVADGSSAIPSGTVISAINSATQITLSANVTTATASNNTLVFQRIWEHARLHHTDHRVGADFAASPGLLFPNEAYQAATNPVVGVMIHRDTVGYGNVNLTEVQVRWNYAENGLPNTALVEVQVFAIEMVYVPQGNFTAGSGGGEASAFTLTTISTGVANTSPSGTGSLGGAAGGFPSGQTAPLANWPNGFPAFYCMKYELSQGQYRDFLNTLTRTQQNSRTGTALAIGTTSVTNRYVLSNTSTIFRRNGIRCDATISANDPITFYCDLNANGTPNESADGEWIACNYTNWSDHAAYMDWAGLRPMTELELEKAARGFMPPVANEYAWGTASIAGTAYSLANGGSLSENISTNYTTVANTGNANYSVTRGTTASPFRVGIFAANVNNRDRITSGASYWGIMELSGNLWERVVTIAHATGRNFTGQHGDGSLSPGGFATNSDWPGWASGEVTSAAGAGAKAGDHNNVAAWSRISDRGTVNNGSNARALGEGSRGVRSVGCDFSANAPTLDSLGSSVIGWVLGNAAADNFWTSVAFGNGLFVAVSRDGANRVMTSPDGQDWTARVAPTTSQWNYVTFGNGIFVAVGANGGVNNYMSSSDGISWTQRTGPDINLNSIVYGNGLFVASGTSAINANSERIVTSPDGITWTARSGPDNVPMRGIGFGNGTFVAVSSNGPVWSSTDGINWIERTSPANNQWYSVAHGNGLFVVVGKSGAGNRVMTSNDGITWTIRSSAADNQWYDVVFGEGLFVAVAIDGSGNRVMTSTDGINWSSMNAAAENAWFGIGFGNGRFVSVAASGSGNRAMILENQLGSIRSFKLNESGNFNWLVPPGWEIVSGQGTNQIEVQINSLPGTIRVGAVNECGASALITTLTIN